MAALASTGVTDSGSNGPAPVLQRQHNAARTAPVRHPDSAAGDDAEQVERLLDIVLDGLRARPA